MNEADQLSLGDAAADEQSSPSLPMTTAEIKAAMIARYAAPEWTLLFEVGNANGLAQSTRADAVAVSSWPSRGNEVWGFEFKAHRSDWTRELANGAKAEPVAQYCDRWSVVASAGVIKDIAEVPSTWGYFLAAKGKLRAMKAAPLLTPRHIDRAFLASCLRRATEHDHDVIEAAVRKARADAEREFAKRKERPSTTDQAARDAAALREAVDEFERASGIQITAYDGRRLGEAARAAELMLSQRWRGLPALISLCEGFAKRAREIQSSLCDPSAAGDRRL